jgi:hypothetical protein
MSFAPFPHHTTHKRNGDLKCFSFKEEEEK